MDKRNLTEQEIRSRYIRPAIVRAGWEAGELREEFYFTDGRMQVGGEHATRGESHLPEDLLG